MSDAVVTERPHRDADLATILREAQPQEIDVLVDIITDFGKGRLALDATTKRELVSARHGDGDERYSEEQLNLLAEEIRQFGGHSASNLARRLLNKPALPYREIVDDVYAKLGGTATGKSLAQKEREIARGLFGPAWRELSPRERHQRCTSTTVLSGRFRLDAGDARAEEAGIVLGAIARDAAMAGLGAAMYAGKFGGRTLLTTIPSRAALGPAAAPATMGMASHLCLREAYRVTIPCVAQMGWILLRRDADAQAPLGPDAAENEEAAEREAAPATLELSTETGAMLMRLTALEGSASPALAAGASTALADETIATFNALLSSLPQAAALAELKRGHYVRCNLPLDTLTPSAQDDGTFRAWVSEGGRIREQALLSAPDSLQEVLVSAAAWNLLSSAVGQKHLHDINEKLNTIKRQLDEVQGDLEALRHNEVAGLVDYVQSLLSHLPVDGLNKLARVTLELRLSDMAKLEAWFQDRREAELKKTAALEADSLFRASRARLELEEALRRSRDWIRGELQVIQLRVISLALLHRVLPQARYVNEARNRLEKLRQLAGSLPAQYRHIYRSKLALTNSVTNEVADDDTLRVEGLLNDLASSLAQSQLQTRQLHRSLFGHADQAVLLRLDDGIVTAANWLDNDEAG